MPRERLPLGVWACADGSVVIFDLGLHPIAARCPVTNKVEPMQPTAWVDWVEQRYLWRGLEAAERKSVLRLFLQGQDITPLLDEQRTVRPALPV